MYVLVTSKLQKAEKREKLIQSELFSASVRLRSYSGYDLARACRSSRFPGNLVEKCGQFIRCRAEDQMIGLEIHADRGSLEK